jgi:cyclophilin family peptidyl-prolyl cis-trans isomerase
MQAILAAFGKIARTSPEDLMPNARLLITARLLLAALSLAVGLTAHAQSNPRVQVETNMGKFVIELDSGRAPLTVANFLQYVRDGFYNGTVFHRVISGFVAQGGGFDEKYQEKPTKPGVPNESGNGLSNRRGTVGLARTGEPHSGNAQFYLNLADNTTLDPQPSRWGYAVFGRIVEGMEAVDGIGAVATGAIGPFQRDAPLKPIVIESIEELK